VDVLVMDVKYFQMRHKRYHYRDVRTNSQEKKTAKETVLVFVVGDVVLLVVGVVLKLYRNI
jgi:hypothetical protein